MINDIFTPDPENDPEEEAELTYRLQEAVHEFEAGPDGKCITPTRKYCYEHEVSDYHNPCGAQRSSVLHYDVEPANHCGDYDCMHFEGGYDE